MKVLGWVMFIGGFLYLGTNLTWVGMETAGLMSYEPDYKMLPFQLILWLAITLALTIGGWKLSRKKPQPPSSQN